MKILCVFFVATSFISSAVCQTAQRDSIASAELIFYRAFIPKLNAPLKKVSIYLNGKMVHNLKANTIKSIKVFATGKTYVAIDEKGETATLVNVMPGATYYFKCDIVFGLWFGKPTFVLVKNDVGKAECEALLSKTGH